MKEDTSLKSAYQIPPMIAQTDLMHDFNLASQDASPAPEPPVKPSPDRYRRVQRRSDPNVPTLKTTPQSGVIAGLTATQAFNTAKVGQFYQAPQQVNLASPRNSSASPQIEPLAVQSPGEISRPQETNEPPVRQYASDVAKRYRKQNVGGGQEQETIKMVPGAPGSSRVAPASSPDDFASSHAQASRPSFVSLGDVQLTFITSHIYLTSTRY